MRPRKRLGQHFLQDKSALHAIASALDLDPNDQVLEIGAGAGALTKELAPLVRRLVAVELDSVLALRLQQELASQPSVEILNTNALDINPCTIFEIPTPHGKEEKYTRYKLAGNLPYYITGLLLRHYLETTCRAAIAVLMVQLEVAKRMTAMPGQMSLLAVSCQFYADLSIVRRVPPGAFRPRPEVDSAIVKLVPHESPRYEVPSIESFFRVVRAGFSGRRKQLVNSLTAGLELPKPEVATVLERAGLQPSQRPQEIDLQSWARLARILDGRSS